MHTLPTWAEPPVPVLCVPFSKSLINGVQSPTPEEGVSPEAVRLSAHLSLPQELQAFAALIWSSYAWTATARSFPAEKPWRVWDLERSTKNFGRVNRNRGHMLFSVAPKKVF